ncbi:hypothetical protein C1752_07461 [Acaryochloris thomasi RCC1774]|uniref:YetF C-terminal domain-containing protein n=1 Tax=Acaryochloris thomasi RCC1774 TaxID=1764569 RepID=A0A2W1JHY7_9CYAN|nr:YetF domain-containing protein [Acaryochloris thomasi]PZD71185.1 hypothetical protein C1752_07461 [Acaryochloris thomasi RCC1774]
MINWQWITTTAMAAQMVVLTAIATYLSLLVLTRIAGLRSFAKMSSFDFAITVAIGSLLASILLTKDPPLLQGITALSTLFLLQYLVSWGRRHSPLLLHLVDNQPVLLMAGSKVIERHLDQVRLSDADLKSKLRQAGIVSTEQVLAVVMETTGDVSIFEKGGHTLDLDMFDNVRGKQYLVNSGYASQGNSSSR